MKTTGLHPRVHVDAAEVSSSGNAREMLLTEKVRAAGLNRALSRARLPWRRTLASYDPGKVLLDLALTLALGGDCLA